MSFLSRITSSKEKFYLNVTIHSTHFVLKQRQQFKLVVKRGRKKRQESQLFEYNPTGDTFLECEFGFLITMYKKAKKYLNKKSKITVVLASGLKLGKIKIDLGGIVNTGKPIFRKTDSLLKCKLRGSTMTYSAEMTTQIDRLTQQQLKSAQEANVVPKAPTKASPATDPTTLSESVLERELTVPKRPQAFRQSQNIDLFASPQETTATRQSQSTESADPRKMNRNASLFDREQIEEMQKDIPRATRFASSFERDDLLEQLRQQHAGPKLANPPEETKKVTNRMATQLSHEEMQKDRTENYEESGTLATSKTQEFEMESSLALPNMPEDYDSDSSSGDYYTEEEEKALPQKIDPTAETPDFATKGALVQRMEQVQNDAPMFQDETVEPPPLSPEKPTVAEKNSPDKFDLSEPVLDSDSDEDFYDDLRKQVEEAKRKEEESQLQLKKAGSTPIPAELSIDQRIAVQAAVSESKSDQEMEGADQDQNQEATGFEHMFDAAKPDNSTGDEVHKSSSSSSDDEGEYIYIPPEKLAEAKSVASQDSTDQSQPPVSQHTNVIPTSMSNAKPNQNSKQGMLDAIETKNGLGKSTQRQGACAKCSLF